MPADGSAEVDAYLETVPDDARAALTELRAAIREVAPDATERVSYGVPAFFRDGALVSYAARPRHCSLYVQSPGVVRRLAEQLAEVRVSGATIHFTPDAPLPRRVIELVVRERLAENAARTAARAPGRGGASSAR